MDEPIGPTSSDTVPGYAGLIFTEYLVHLYRLWSRLFKLFGTVAGPLASDLSSEQLLGLVIAPTYTWHYDQFRKGHPERDFLLNHMRVLLRKRYLQQSGRGNGRPVRFSASGRETRERVLRSLDPHASAELRALLEKAYVSALELDVYLQKLLQGNEHV